MNRRTFLYIIIVAFCVLFIGCTSESVDDVEGKWKIDRFEQNGSEVNVSEFDISFDFAEDRTVRIIKKVNSDVFNLSEHWLEENGYVYVGISQDELKTKYNYKLQWINDYLTFKIGVKGGNVATVYLKKN